MLSNRFNALRKIPYGIARKKRIGIFSFKSKAKQGIHKKPGLIPIKVKNKLLVPPGKYRFGCGTPEPNRLPARILQLLDPRLYLSTGTSPPHIRTSPQNGRTRRPCSKRVSRLSRRTRRLRGRRKRPPQKGRTRLRAERKCARGSTRRWTRRAARCGR